MISGNTLTRRRWRDLWWIATALILSAPATAAPKAALWPAHNPHSRAVVDHVPWDRFLKKYVNTGPDGINRVDYAAVTQADKQGLRRYIASLAATPIRGHNREQQFVFWVNLYNAITLHIVLEAYPVASIRDLGVFSSGPWNRELVNVEVRDLTLNDIEHRIVRPIWRDPRTHYAVNCASIGCPNLQTTAFTGEASLSKAAVAYIDHNRGVTVAANGLVVSSIYEWFKEDFGGTDEGIIEHLKKYAEPSLFKLLTEFAEIVDDEYDGSLNDA